MSNEQAERSFSPAVLAHFRRPLHAGVLPGGGGLVGTGRAGTVKSGVMVQVQLRVGADGHIDDVAWLAYGCPATLAACSWTAERICGKPLQEVLAVGASDMVHALELAPVHRGRVLVVEDALRAALDAVVDGPNGKTE